MGPVTCYRKTHNQMKNSTYVFMFHVMWVANGTGNFSFVRKNDKLPKFVQTMTLHALPHRSTLASTTPLGP